MKGIILAGGSGTRLYPLTRGVVKQLLPVYDKPMIYYPLSVLMLAGIRDILIISTPNDTKRFEDLFGNGSDLGIKIQYKIQPSPDGLAQAFLLGEEFIEDEDVCLVLGDNIFYGDGLIQLLSETISEVKDSKKAVVYGYNVKDPERYGVAELDKDMNVISLEEKPANPKSNIAVVGLYFYPKDVVKYAKKVLPSGRGELEITSLNLLYLSESRLKCKMLGRGFAWLDTGTYDSLLEASNFIEVIEKRQGLKIACLEEIAYRKNFISIETLKKHAILNQKNQYGSYLWDIVNAAEN
ncbi:glucose-1-phosphate thymidylyltransferase RfbA [Leptospira meyeri]|uniref:glucose-1-phosphate thymidylyltransferase RfbA n=1 Tax=Leptospira meyeri TaxID=29508 RepID=UPI000C2ADF5B|nr:glucose-1-phosphate thymidylyltransferase RfbA [Leptospira meyeri]PKA27045.1 glucose-1-phosphate thymidylyltransferase [Leptospira sp. mixed culture ATI2-C-A1]MCW7490410.1 glucose-1-phosphate thymidylyltransferase RfbA [Leptospira meyeri]PJZ79428.1 glucose-1-phosphate thymidylyltransferase [Leptospira meyeri]PJZ98548.1 glucose-1-phosphate thymidylyltransferase [Leptospira meyeri]PKA14128.1 glucose-1-phosphate thymidylyltransferase [Leptospira meyeri]